MKADSMPQAPTGDAAPHPVLGHELRPEVFGKRQKYRPIMALNRT